MVEVDLWIAEPTVFTDFCVNHKILPVVNAVPSEGMEITGIQYFISAMSPVNKDFSRFSETFW